MSSFIVHVLSVYYGLRARLDFKPTKIKTETEQTKQFLPIVTLMNQLDGRQLSTSGQWQGNGDKTHAGTYEPA